MELSIIDIIKAICSNEQYNIYASRLISGIATRIKAVRNEERRSANPGMLRFHTAIVSPFMEAEIRDIFLLVPSDQRHLIKGVATLNHLEVFLRSFIGDALNNNINTDPDSSLSRKPGGSQI